jgi:hypothetical protein
MWTPYTGDTMKLDLVVGTGFTYRTATRHFVMFTSRAFGAVYYLSTMRTFIIDGEVFYELAQLVHLRTYI